MFFIIILTTFKIETSCHLCDHTEQAMIGTNDRLQGGLGSYIPNVAQMLAASICHLRAAGAHIVIVRHVNVKHQLLLLGLEVCSFDRFLVPGLHNHTIYNMQVNTLYMLG